MCSEYCKHTGISKPECSCYECTCEHLEAHLPADMQIVRYAALAGTQPKFAVRKRMSPAEQAASYYAGLSSDQNPSK